MENFVQKGLYKISFVIYNRGINERTNNMQSDWQLANVAKALSDIAELMQDLNSTLTSIEDDLDQLNDNIDGVNNTLSEIKKGIEND